VERNYSNFLSADRNAQFAHEVEETPGAIDFDAPHAHLGGAPVRDWP